MKTPIQNLSLSLCPMCSQVLPSAKLLICSHCKADLLPFRIENAEDLAEKYDLLLVQRLKTDGQHQLEKQALESEIAAVRGSQARTWWWILALPFAVLLCRKVPPPVSKQKLAAQSAQIADLQQDLDSLNRRKIVYILQKGDRLSDLGVRFFAHADSGYRIGRENGILAPEQWTNLRPGDTIWITR